MLRASLTLLLLIPAPRLAAEEPTFGGRKLSEWQTMLKEDPTPRKRRAAVVALGQIGADNREVLPGVLVAVGKALRADASPAVRQQAAVVLGQQRVDDKTAGVLPDLVEAIRIEKEPAVRRELAVAAGRYGAYAKQAVGPLAPFLKDADPAVRAAAADALGRIGSAAGVAVADVLPLTRDADRAVRQAAVFALGRIEPEEKGPAAAALLAVLNADPDPDMRREAVVSLGFLGERSSDVVLAVAAVLADKNAELRATAALTLARFGSTARAAEHALLKVIQSDPDKAVRLNAVRTVFAGYGPDAAKLIPTFTDRLAADPDFEVRVAISEEFGGLGPSGVPALPALRAAQRDPQIKVREAATAAIKRIETPPPKPKP